MRHKSGLSVLVLLLGSVLGIVSAVVETASSRWAESVPDHWVVTVAMALVVAPFWVVLVPFDRRGRRTRSVVVGVVLLMVALAALGIVQNIAELISMATVQGPLGLLFLLATVVLAAGSIVLSVAAIRRGVFPRWVPVLLIAASLCVTVPLAPVLVGIGVPAEALHAPIFLVPCVLAIGVLRELRGDRDVGAL